MKTNWEPLRLAKSINITLLSFSGTRVIDTTRQQSDLQFDGLECETAPVCLVATRYVNTSPSSSPSPATAVRQKHIRARCIYTALVHAPANRAHFMAEQRPICVAQPAAAEVNSGRMDGGARGCNGRIVLHRRRN